jgi:hypothetical protein
VDVTYLTRDDVNAATAAELAAAAGVARTVGDARGPAEVAAADRLVLDLDYLPPEFATELVAWAGRGAALGWAAVHSYNLTPKQARALRAAGATVARRLTAELFRPSPSAVGG